MFYIKNMAGCDIADQLRSYYDIRIKAHKWTHHVFFWLLDTAIVNAYQLYLSYYPTKSEKKYPQARFRRRLLFQMQERVVKMRRLNRNIRAMSPTPALTKSESTANRMTSAGMPSKVLRTGSWLAPDSTPHFQVRAKRAKCKLCLHCAAGEAHLAFGKNVSKVRKCCSVSGANICDKHWKAFHDGSFPSCQCMHYQNGKKVHRSIASTAQGMRSPVTGRRGRSGRGSRSSGSRSKRAGGLRRSQRSRNVRRRINDSQDDSSDSEPETVYV